MTHDVDRAVLEGIVRGALREDIGSGDVSTQYVVPPDVPAHAAFVAKSPGVVAGWAVVREVFRQVDPALTLSVHVIDGTRAEAGQVIALADGPAGSLLTAERVALNFLQRLSGIATMTAQAVAIVAGRARVVDTRKTTPGLRVLEKMAVRLGGGHNHRMGLYDAVMVKDNHIVAGGGIATSVRRARDHAPHTMSITVECANLDQVEEALAAGADILLLDNMSDAMRSEAVRIVAGRAVTEASGGVNLGNIGAVADTGVDVISLGALTHSAPALDISLQFRG